jgi:hypothetical protein
MTTAMARQSLTDFVTDQRASAIALTGPWGSGKTWTWNRVIEGTAASNPPPFKRYAYVSLFGLDSMAELKAALFENAVPPGHVADGATTATWREEMSGVLEAGSVSEGAKRSGLIAYWKGRKHAKLVASLLPGWGAALRSATFLAVRDYVVCLDDIERKGAGLSMTEVLGLVSQLTEQRNCRVIVILNEEGFGPEGKVEKDRFNGFREKVLDREVVFAPRPAECADLVFDNKADPYQWAASYAVELGITNIRILQRICRLIDDFLPALKSARDRVIRSFIHSATLLTWCFYGEAGGAPAYAFVRTLSGASFLGFDDKEKTRSSAEREWLGRLSDYGFYSVDDLDEEIFRALENGYLDAGKVDAAVNEANDRADAESASGSMTEAWGLLHNSFDDNTTQFLDRLVRTATADARWLRYFDAEAVCFVLRALGDDTKSSAFAAHWVAVNGAVDPARLARPTDDFGPGTRDNAFRDMAETAAMANAQTPSLADTIKGLVGRNGWNPIDEEILATASADDYIDFFRSRTGDPHLSSYIRLCLKFGGFAGNPAYRRIGVTVSNALRLLATESPINALRVANFTLFEDTAPSPSAEPPKNPFSTAGENPA